MKRKGQCSYSSEFKREAASLVISQGYGIVAAARAVWVSKSTISTWVRCLRQEQKGVIRSLRPLTTEEGERIGCGVAMSLISGPANAGLISWWCSTCSPVNR